MFNAPLRGAAEEALLNVARDLMSEEGENPEYDRAIIEMVGTLLGYNLADERDQVVARIKGYAYQVYLPVVVTIEPDGTITTKPQVDFGGAPWMSSESEDNIYAIPTLTGGEPEWISDLRVEDMAGQFLDQLLDHFDWDKGQA